MRVKYFIGLTTGLYLERIMSYVGQNIGVDVKQSQSRYCPLLGFELMTSPIATEPRLPPNKMHYLSYF